MTYLREKAKLLLVSEARLRLELRKANERVVFYQLVAFTGWSGLIIVLAQEYLP